MAMDKALLKSEYIGLEDGSGIWKGHLACLICGFGPMEYEERTHPDMLWSTFPLCPTCGEGMESAVEVARKIQRIKLFKPEWFTMEEA